MGARQVGKSLRAITLRPRRTRTARWERCVRPNMNGGAAFVRSLAVGMFGEWAGRVVSPRAGFCASGRPLSARSAYADTGANGWIILPFSRKERLFGHEGKWMDHPHLSAAKSVCSDTRANGWIIPTPLSAAKERLFGHGGKWMDHLHPPFQPQRAPVRIQGQMDGSSPLQPQRAPMRTQGQMDGSFPFHPQKSPMRTRGAGG